MGDDGAIGYQLILIAATIGSVGVLVVISLLRAVAAAASPSRLEELHSVQPDLIDHLYDARRLGSPQRSLLMVFDTVSVGAVVAIGLLHIVGTVTILEHLLAASGVVIGVVILKACIHVIGDLAADTVIVPSARALRFLYHLCSPCIIAIERIVEVLHQSRHSKEEAREQVEEELTAIMEEAVEEGTFQAGEVRILQNLLRVREVRVEDVMTPRNVIAGLSADMTLKQASKLPELQTYSRLPVWEGNDIDRIIGYVLSRDVLVHALAGSVHLPVRSLVRAVVFIPENITLDRALEEFLKHRQHMFIVVDEYGGVEGLITLEDVVETILGAEIVDEADRVVDMRQFAQQQRDRRIAQQNMHQVVESPTLRQ